jgi:tRNA(fMet)-specific endonuclease VapC
VSPARRYLLDTNIVSQLVRDPQGEVSRRIARVGEESVCTSVIVACELRFGAKKRNSPRLTAQLEQILGVLPILALEPGTDTHYANVRNELERRGTPIGANDMLIAAHALASNLILVTDNVTEFERVEDLVLQNWLRGVRRRKRR